MYSYVRKNDIILARKEASVRPKERLLRLLNKHKKDTIQCGAACGDVTRHGGSRSRASEKRRCFS